MVIKKKVLFVIDTLQHGGAEQSLLANAIRFQQIEPVICHVYTGEILKQQFLNNKIKVYSLNIHKKYGFLHAYQQLKEIIRKEKPELLVGYLTRSEIITRYAGKFQNVPVVGTFVNDLYCSSYTQNLSWHAKQLVQIFKWINKISSKICIGFVSNSQAIKETNAKHLDIPLDKIQVINRGRESYKFKCREFTVTKESDPIRFINVSRLYSVKGQKYMILGFKKFVEKHPSATLSIVGEGPMREELTHLIVENGLERKVILLGARNDVPSLISEYDCFVFPSLVEGFSGAIVEAMFAGLPVLASDIPQNKEAISHLKTGYLFKPESESEVEKAMLWFNENRSIANELAKKAFYYAKENFELEKVVSQFEQYLLNKLVHQK